MHQDDRTVQTRARTARQEIMSMLTLLLRVSLPLLAILLFVGCATRFDIGAAEHHITPQQAAHNSGLAQNKIIAWCGTIV